MSLPASTKTAIKETQLYLVKIASGLAVAPQHKSAYTKLKKDFDAYVKKCGTGKGWDCWERDTTIGKKIQNFHWKARTLQGKVQAAVKAKLYKPPTTSRNDEDPNTKVKKARQYLPWILGGVATLGLVLYLRKK